MKNFWLNRKKTKKFKGKFQEAEPIQKGGRLYGDTQTSLVQHLRDKYGKTPAEFVKDAYAEKDEIAERWKAPESDEDIYIPIRPKQEPKNMDKINALCDKIETLRKVHYLDVSKLTMKEAEWLIAEVRDKYYEAHRTQE